MAARLGQPPHAHVAAAPSGAANRCLPSGHLCQSIFLIDCVLRALRGHGSPETEAFLVLAGNDWDPTYRHAAVWQPGLVGTIPPGGGSGLPRKRLAAIPAQRFDRLPEPRLPVLESVPPSSGSAPH